MEQQLPNKQELEKYDQFVVSLVATGKVFFDSDYVTMNKKKLLQHLKKMLPDYTYTVLVGLKDKDKK